MYIVSEIIAVIAEIALVHLYMKDSFPTKDHPWWIYGVFYTIFGGILVYLSFLPNASFIRLLFCILFFFLIPKYLFVASFSQALFASASFCGIYVLNELLSIGLFSLFHVNIQAIMSYGSARAISIIVSHTLLWLCVLIVLAITKQKRTAITAPFLLTLAPGYIAGILLGVAFCRQILSGDNRMTVPVLVSAIGLLYMNILIVLYAEQAKGASDQRLKAELAEHHYAMQEQYYDQLRAEQEETRAMFHDINKSLQAMRALASEANSEGANSLLSETQKIFEDLGTVVDVGNNVVSIILNEYRQLADDAGITFDYDVSIPHTLSITAVDLYVLLGNTLDNAIEACESLPEEQRYIHLQFRTFHEILFLQIKNPYSKDYPLRIRGKNHGYGLQNVRKCVKKHNGHISAEQENGVFTLSLRLADCVPATTNMRTLNQ